MGRKRHIPISWERDVEGLLGEDEKRKISTLRQKIHNARKKNYQDLITFGILFVIFTGVPITILWFFTELENQVRADIANGIVALVLASWTLLEPKSTTLDQSSVEETLGKVVTRSTFTKIIHASEIPITTNKAIPFIAAAVLLVIIILNNFL